VGRKISVPGTFLGRIKFALSLMVKRFGTAGRIIYPEGVLGSACAAK
jgi:hypothetical protein